MAIKYENTKADKKADKGMKEGTRKDNKADAKATKKPKGWAAKKGGGVLGC